MNSAGLATNSLSSSSLNHALRSQPSVSSAVGEVSPVDDSEQLHGGHSHNSHVSHNNHANHPQLNHHLHLLLHHNTQYGSMTQLTPLQESFSKVNDNVAKLENDVATLSQELAYFRHVVDFQNLKIEKLTQLLSDVLQNKDTSSIVNLLQSLQEGDPFNVNDNQDSVDNLVPESVHESVHDAVHDPVHDSVHDVTADLPSLQLSNVVQVPGVVDVLGVSLNNNMDPQLHQVAQAAVLAQGKGGKRKRSSYAKVNGNSDGLKPQLLRNHQQQQSQQQRQMQQASMQQQRDQQSRALVSMQQQRQQQQQQQQAQQQQQQQQAQQAQQNQQNQQQLLLTQDSGKDLVLMPGLEVVVDDMGGRKKPKITVDFLHNPMNVKDIYDEFTRGFRGQPPLREMDERFGKHEWRGDSRSKELRRFQRRKKLCDAIERGMAKYGKSAMEIIDYIEDFRGDKSLTWVMNGNLPRDLLE